MTTNETTPAPWLVNDKDYDRFGKTVWVESKDGNFVCELVRDSKHREHANARLIAAAPEMLAELERIVNTCEYCDEGEIEYQPNGLDGWLPTGDANFVHEECPRCSKARVAVAKAKGEQ